MQNMMFGSLICKHMVIQGSNYVSYVGKVKTDQKKKVKETDRLEYLKVRSIARY